MKAQDKGITDNHPTTEKTLITRQVYHLAGVVANKATTPNHELTILNTLDENEFDCVCSEIVDGKKDFVIIIKNDDSAILDSATALMVEPFKRVAGVSYLESDNEQTMVIRYLIGDHTDIDSADRFFDEVRHSIKKNAAHRGWEVGEKGELIKRKAKYFY